MTGTFSNQVKLSLKSILLKTGTCSDEQLLDVGFGHSCGRANSGHLGTGWHSPPPNQSLALFGNDQFHGSFADLPLIPPAGQKDYPSTKLPRPG
jgi:hypothetical protein